jgi:hypothetical protein
MRNSSFWILLCVPLLRAHQPGANEGITEIEDATISYAIYGDFPTGSELREVHLTLPTPYALPFELLVPHIAGNEDFRPMYAVVGPGLPAPTEEEAALLPKALPEGWGVFLDQNDNEPRDVVFEGFLRRVSWSTGTIAIPLREGDHEIWIWSPEQTPGEFVMGFGVEEDFSEGFGGVFADWGTYAY